MVVVLQTRAALGVGVVVVVVVVVVDVLLMAQTQGFILRCLSLSFTPLIFSQLNNKLNKKSYF